MNDPLRQLVANRDDNSAQDDVISVEEAIDCRLANSRFFSLVNNKSLLNVIIATDSSITSVNIGGYETVVKKDYYNELHETWAIGEKPYQRLTNLNWNSHVRGSELVLSSLSGNSVSSSLIYDLTRQNELNCLAKLKNIHLQHKVQYFNLNPASSTSRTAIDGHMIAIRCNAGFHRIQTRMTKLLCQCNNSSPVSPQSLIGDIPYELRQYQTTETSTSSTQNNLGDDFIVCDAIYSLESTCTLDFLQAHLQYGNRILVFEIQSVKSTTNAGQSRGLSSNGGIFNNYSLNNVTSSTRATSLGYNSPNDLMFYNHMIYTKLESEDGSYLATSSTTTTANEHQGESLAGVNQDRVKLEQLDHVSNNNRPLLPPIPVSSPTDLAKATDHACTMLRLRVRITNFGICIMPYMMTNYIFTYKFAW